jgi:hypothetical protein
VCNYCLFERVFGRLKFLPLLLCLPVLDVKNLFERVFGRLKFLPLLLCLPVLDVKKFYNCHMNALSESAR